MKKISDRDRIDYLSKVLNRLKKISSCPTWRLWDGEIRYSKKLSLREVLDAEIRKTTKGVER